MFSLRIYLHLITVRQERDSNNDTPLLRMTHSESRRNHVVECECSAYGSTLSVWTVIVHYKQLIILYLFMKTLRSPSSFSLSLFFLEKH